MRKRERGHNPVEAARKSLLVRAEQLGVPTTSADGSPRRDVEIRWDVREALHSREPDPIQRSVNELLMLMGAASLPHEWKWID